MLRTVLTTMAATCTLASAQNNDPTIASFVDTFIGDMESELKTQLLVLRDTPSEVNVPSFKLTEWEHGKDDPIVNATFNHNPELDDARLIIQQQATKVAAIESNVTQFHKELHSTRVRITDAEIELASTNAAIIAAEATMKHLVKKDDMLETVEETKTEKLEKLEQTEQDETMKLLVTKTKHAVQKKTQMYNDALNHVLKNAGAILSQQRAITKEKKTVLQETADRAALPDIVDMLAEKTPVLAVQAADASKNEQVVKKRMAQLKLDILKTQEEIRLMDVAAAAAANGASTTTTTTNASSSSSTSTNSTL